MEDDLNMFGEILDGFPKEYVEILNIPKYKSMVSAIEKIKRIVDGYLSEYEERADYSFRFCDKQHFLLSRDVVFGVTIPNDIEIAFRISQLSDVISEMSESDILSIEPCADGRIDLLFEFKNVKNLLSVG